MLTINRFGLGIALSFSLLAAVAARGQEYKIKLRHAEKVGDSCPIASEASSTQTLTATLPGQPPHDTETKLEAQLAGTRKVLEVDDKGNATKLSVTLTKCTANGGSLLDPGTVIVAERDGHAPTKYLVNELPVAPNVSQAMELLLELTDPTAPDDDTVFGTPEPRKVGDSWPVNADDAAKEAEESGVPVKKENLSGTTKLAGVDKIDGKDVLHITGNMTVKDLKGPGPGGLTFQSGDLNIDLGGTFSADDSAIPLIQTQSTKAHFIGSAAGPDNASITVEVKMTRVTKLTTGAGVKSADAK